MKTIRVAVHSDLHVNEIGPDAARMPCIRACDVLVLAGDIAPPCARRLRQGRHGVFEWARRQFGNQVPIVAVMGNHEYNHFVYDDVLSGLKREAVEQGVHFLHNTQVELFGIRFLGTPLFSSLCLPGVDKHQCLAATDQKMLRLSSRANQTCICGADRVCNLNTLSVGTRTRDGRPLGATWLKSENSKARRFLREALQSPVDMPTVVVSHWAPSLSSIPMRERPLTKKHAYWASDHEDLAALANVWIHGHIHDPCDYRLGDRPTHGRIIANPFGNSSQHRNTAYRPQAFIDVPTGQLPRPERRGL